MRKRCFTRSTVTIVLILIASLSIRANATVSVVSGAEAQKAIGAAKPGDEILIADGIHKDFRLTLRGKGTKDKPIVLRAANAGKAILTGKVRIAISGEYLVVKDLVFDQAWESIVVYFGGATHCVLSNCAFIECGNPKSTYSHIVSFRGNSQHNTMERCLMQANMSMGVGVRIGRNDYSNTHNRIAWNYFKDIERRASNGQEAVQIGQGSPTSDQIPQHTVVEHNLFDRASGDAEIISSKSSYNILRHNTTRNCRGMFVLRFGSHTRVEGNWFLGGSGGVRAYGEFQEIVNNYVEGGGYGIYAPDGGVWNKGYIGYAPLYRSVVAHNTLVNCSKVGLYVGQPNNHPLTVQNLDMVANHFLANLIVSSRGELIRDEGTIQSAWQGNIVHATGGAKAGYKHAGIANVDPKLAKRDGIWRPAAAGSAAVNPKPVSYHNVNAPLPGCKTDIEGQPRDKQPDAGCDEASDRPVLYPPLTALDVGPAWMAGDPSRLSRIPSPQPTPVIPKKKKK